MFSTAEIHSDLKTRPEGTRIKHVLNHNSIKMYDKQESVLRIETTVNDARGMKAYRASEADPDGPKAWRKLRKGVADLPRRAQVSQAANERYLEASSTVEVTEALSASISVIRGSILSSWCDWCSLRPTFRDELPERGQEK